MTRVNGMDVIVDDRVPREHVADEVYSYLPHPFWRWAWRTFLRREHPPSMERGRPIFEDKVLVVGNKLIMSNRTFTTLRVELARSSKAFEAKPW